MRQIKNLRCGKIFAERDEVQRWHYRRFPAQFVAIRQQFIRFQRRQHPKDSKTRIIEASSETERRAIFKNCLNSATWMLPDPCPVK